MKVKEIRSAFSDHATSSNYSSLFRTNKGKFLAMSNLPFHLNSDMMTKAIM